MPRNGKIAGNPHGSNGELGTKGVPTVEPEVKKAIQNMLTLVPQTRSIEEVIPPALKSTKKEDLVRITMMKDTSQDFPEMYLDVFVVGPIWEERMFAQMFARSRCKRAKSILEADLVVFTGGEDVDPQLYGEEKHYSTHFSKKRDDDDMGIYLMCLEHGIPMLGICRGAQFLHVMNGGKLYQDVDHHNGDHCMWDVKTRKKINRVSSVHHQMCIPQNQNSFQLIGTANVARNRHKNPHENDIGIKIDVEAFWYRDTCAIGIQGHPEYRGYHEFAKWTLDTINDLVVLNPDIEWSDGNRRMKKEFMAERDARAKTRSSALL